MLLKFNVLVFVFLFSVPFVSFSQVRLSGKIVDQSDSPVEFAEVVLLKNNTFFKGSSTDENGAFLFDVKEDHYLIFARQFGVEFFKKELDLKSDTCLNDIVVDNTITLKEVNVEAQKRLIERKVDRLVFHTENSVAAIGGDALDALRLAPRINVKSDQIAMVGKSEVSVMVNDRMIPLSGQELISYLKSIKSDNIKSIEVITNPSAKYSAEGNSGIVNIRLKKALNDSWNASLNSVYTQSKYATGLMGGSFNFQKNRLSIFSNINYEDGSIGPVEKQTTYYPEQTWNDTDRRRDYSNTLSASVGIDYRFSDKLTMGLQLMGNHYNGLTKDWDQMLFENNAKLNLDSLSLTSSRWKMNIGFGSMNYHLVYTPDTLGKKFSVDVDYFSHNNTNNKLLSTDNYWENGNKIPNSFASQSNLAQQDVSNFSVNIDMEHPMKGIDLNYGGKLSFTWNNNDIVAYNLASGTPIYNPQQSNLFKYKENTQALYFSASKRLGEKWEAKTGLRMEYTQTEGNSITLEQIDHNNYIRLFPTMYLSYKADEDHSISFDYGRRISRPSFGELDPFKWYNNPYTYYEGNPKLQPSYTQNIELSYSYMDSWTSTLYYSKTSHSYGMVTLIEKDIRITNEQNFCDIQNFGITESVTFNLKNRWTSVNAADWSYLKVKSLVPRILPKLDGFAGSISSNNDFSVNKSKTILLAINGVYNFRGVDQLDHILPNGRCDIALKLLLFEKKLALSITGDDIFHSDITSLYNYTDGIKYTWYYYYDFQKLRISLRYKFGNSKINAEQREVRNIEERDRVR
jgi:hypothetical protein